jgi:hypothetical protein
MMMMLLLMKMKLLMVKLLPLLLLTAAPKTADAASIAAAFVVAPEGGGILTATKTRRGHHSRHHNVQVVATIDNTSNNAGGVVLRRRAHGPTNMHLLPSLHEDSWWPSTSAESAGTSLSTPSPLPSSSLLLGAGEGALDVVKNLVIGIGGVIAVLALLVVVLSSFVIPKAAEQLEQQAKAMDMELWEEYENRLEPGEVLAMRPDLMQELGNIVTARTMAKYEEMEKEMIAAKKKAEAAAEAETMASDADISASSRSSTLSASSRNVVVDVDILSKEETKD